MLPPCRLCHRGGAGGRVRPCIQRQPAGRQWHLATRWSLASSPLPPFLTRVRERPGSQARCSLGISAAVSRMTDEAVQRAANCGGIANRVDEPRGQREGRGWDQGRFDVGRPRNPCGRVVRVPPPLPTTQHQPLPSRELDRIRIQVLPPVEGVDDLRKRSIQPGVVDGVRHHLVDGPPRDRIWRSADEVAAELGDPGDDAGPGLLGEGEPPVERRTAPEAVAAVGRASENTW